MKARLSAVALALLATLIFSKYGQNGNAPEVHYDVPENAVYQSVNDNVPEFTDEEITQTSFEKYENLDALGRCRTATACVGIDIMPTEERGAIGQIKPTGWQTVKYDFVDGKYLYNRCHLIGFQLTGENANEKNLITGTRYFNVEGMLPFENMVADYVKETENHVMYRVTPVFEGTNLVASGVKMEGYSVEDGGEGISFNVYVPNRQPGVIINYADGTSSIDKGYTGTQNNQTSGESETGDINSYVLNASSKKIHLPSCSSVKNIKEANKTDFVGSKKELINQGYSPCGNCNP